MALEILTFVLGTTFGWGISMGYEKSFINKIEKADDVEQKKILAEEKKEINNILKILKVSCFVGLGVAGVVYLLTNDKK